MSWYSSRVIIGGFQSCVIVSNTPVFEQYPDGSDIVTTPIFDALTNVPVVVSILAIVVSELEYTIEPVPPQESSISILSPILATFFSRKKVDIL